MTPNKFPTHKKSGRISYLKPILIKKYDAEQITDTRALKGNFPLLL